MAKRSVSINTNFTAKRLFCRKPFWLSPFFQSSRIRL